ncbi:hypothetical protein BDP27DRAFT_1426709 [Rhodocollybia butyracea]|uniref:Uncharacterized protein n=1 Tax=Rhodocollybia butyracea TaxID=206335 RepID=A0A9P5PHY9_9AGAR|nr:hypothetical protein BDP27DRAFT_1426709 [Rhodocollybia butyracea]
MTKTLEDLMIGHLGILEPLQDHKLARRPRPHLSSPTSQEELDVFSGSTRVAPFLVLQMVKSSCAYPELIDGNPAAHLSYSGEFHLVSTWPHSGWLQKDKSSWKGRPISPSNPMLYLRWSVSAAPTTVALAPVSFASALIAVSVAPQPSSGFNKPNLNPAPTPATDPNPDPDIGLGALATAHRGIGGSTLPTP